MTGSIASAKASGPIGSPCWTPREEGMRVSPKKRGVGHLACEILGVNLFRHLQAKRMFKYYRSVLRSKNGVLIKLKYYWHFYSDIKINIERIFKCDYDVEEVFDNFDKAILSRIDFIERNEPRSSYLNVIFKFLHCKCFLLNMSFVMK